MERYTVLVVRCVSCVQEALRRIPAHERAFRIQRAVQVNSTFTYFTHVVIIGTGSCFLICTCVNSAAIVMKTVLPKDQRSTYEEDRQKGR